MIDKNNPDLLILWETWLSKQPSLIDKRYETHRTIDNKYQGVCIIAKRGMIEKTYMNNEPYILATQLAGVNKTIIIGVYMKETEKEHIMYQLIKLWQRIRKKYTNPHIILFGDLNTNSRWTINKIERILNLKSSKENKSIITRKQQRNDNSIENTLDYFLSSDKINEISTIETDASDHKPLITKIMLKDVPIKRKWFVYKCSNTVNKANIEKLFNTNWPNEFRKDTKDIFVKRTIIRSVIKLQENSNQIMNENTKWEEKNIKLNDLRNQDFKNTLKSLNTYNKTDKEKFFKIINNILKFKIRGKLAKGIKTEEGIIYNEEKDRLAKRYFEELYNNEEKLEVIANNGIFNYELEIERAIKSLSKSRATGIDGIPSSALKQDKNSQLINKIEKWFKDWVIEGDIPDYAMTGRLVLISKNNTETPPIDETRAITILPAITKFLETAIIHHFEKITKSDIFNKNQRGFTKGWSTLDNIKDVLAIANELKMKKTKNKPALLFFDFVKAYDSVPRNKLILKLQKYNIPWNILKLLSRMLSKFKLTIGKETISTKRGLIQGSVLSPILFNLFINDLLITYEEENIITRAYADDIVWIWNSSEQTMKAIQIMKTWWENNGMAINGKKSGIMRILRRIGKVKPTKNDLNIPEVRSYKYLGVLINQSCKVDDHWKFIKTKVLNYKRMIGMLKPSITDLRSRLLLFNTTIKPQITYAWKALYPHSKTAKDKIESAIYQSLKALMSIRCNVSKSKLLEVLNLIEKKNDEKRNLIEKLSLKVIKLRVNWLFRYRSKRLWTWSHPINSEEIINTCIKTRDWRSKWTEKLNQHGLPLHTALMTIKHLKRENVNDELQHLANDINTATEELVKWYFQN